MQWGTEKVVLCRHCTVLPATAAWDDIPLCANCWDALAAGAIAQVEDKSRLFYARQAACEVLARLRARFGNIPAKHG